MKLFMAFMTGMGCGIALIAILEAVSIEPKDHVFEPSMCSMRLPDGRELQWREGKSADGYTCHNPLLELPRSNED